MEAKKLVDGIPIKVARICSNDTWPLLYLPKAAIEELGLRKGVKVLLSINDDKCLVIRPITKPDR